jgi:hypothetical protein
MRDLARGYAKLTADAAQAGAVRTVACEAGQRGLDDLLAAFVVA